MGDLAPPVHCNLVTSSTGESFSSPSPLTKKRHSYTNDGASEALARKDNNNNQISPEIIKKKNVVVTGKEIPLNDKNNNSQYACGSYGSPPYGPCDTTLTASDDDRNNTPKAKEQDKEEEEDDDDDDSFIVVASRRSKIKGRSASAVRASVDTKPSKDIGVAQDWPITFAKTLKSSEAVSSTTAAPPALPPPPVSSRCSDAKAESASSLPLHRPVTGSRQSHQQLPQPHHPEPQSHCQQQSVHQRSSYFSSFLGPFSSSSLGGGASAPARGFSAADSSESLSFAGAALSQPTSTSLDPWFNPRSSSSSAFPRDRVGNPLLSAVGSEVSGINSGSNLSHSSSSSSIGFSLPLKPASNCDGDSNDGTESECGSVSG